MKLLKILGLAVIVPFLVIGLSSCNDRALFDVQVNNADAWNDTFYINDIIEEVEYVVENMNNFNYGVAGAEGNAARIETAGVIRSQLTNLLEDNERHGNWDADFDVTVLREDNVFAFRSVVLITLRDNSDFNVDDVTFADGFVYEVTGVANFTYLTNDNLQEALLDAIELRSITFYFERPTTNQNIVREFVLNFINGVLYGHELDLLDNVNGAILIDLSNESINWTITLPE